MRNINLHLSTPTSRTRILHWLIKHHSFRFYIFRVCQLWDWYKVFHRALWSRYKAVADWGFWQVVQRSRWLQSLRSARWCSSWQKCDGGSFGTTCEERWIFGGSLLLPSQRWNRKQPQVSSWNNFQRIFDKVGTKLYDKLFGCALVVPAPLPVSFISFLLKKENANLDKQASSNWCCFAICCFENSGSDLHFSSQFDSDLVDRRTKGFSKVVCW